METSVLFGPSAPTAGLFDGPRTSRSGTSSGALPLSADSPPSDVLVTSAEIAASSITDLGDPIFNAAPGIYQVAGSATQSRTFTFQWTERQASYDNEFGLFTVDDEQGRVDGLLPTDTGYAEAALRSVSRQTIFASGEGAGAWENLTLSGGERFAFYLLQDTNTDSWLRCNPSNQAGEKAAFFSLSGANPDGIEHVRTTEIADDISRFAWEDLWGGGDQDFDDVVFTLHEAGLKTPGTASQSVTGDFTWQERQASYNNEMGLFRVDDASGRIGALHPGDVGYAAAALSLERRQTIFTSGQTQGATAQTTLTGDQYLGWYLIQDASTEQWVGQNPSNHPGEGPLAFFSYADANPDGLAHVQYFDGNTMGWEDLMGGGDLDYDDVVFQYRFQLNDTGDVGTPGGGDIPLPELPIPTPPGDGQDVPLPPGTLLETLVNETVVLREENNFESTYRVPFTIPDRSAVLSFQYTDLQLDTSDREAINDAFEVLLLDRDGNPLTHTLANTSVGGGDAFYNITEEEGILAAPGVTAEGQTVSLNLVGLTPGEEAELVFRLVNNDGDTQTSIRITDATLNAAAIEARATTAIPIAVDRRASSFTLLNEEVFNTLEDVTPSVEVLYQRTAFQQDTNTLYTDITLRNTGQYNVEMPLLMVVEHLSDPSVRVTNADGVLPDGRAYYDLGSWVDGAALAPGDETSRRTLSFWNPSGGQFAYDLAFLAVPQAALLKNRAPQFTSTPVLDGSVDEAYRYEVTATDPDGGPVSYRLVTGPNGMVIDEGTGQVQWTPEREAAGAHSIIIQAEDSQGGKSQQRFTLNVQPPIPDNYAPIITSDAVVTASTSEPYVYDVDAVDAEGDTLTYSLVEAPEGAAINPETGVITWETAGQAVNTYEFTVQVTDDQGGADIQAFALPLFNTPLGEIRGTVWEDINGNRVQDTALIQGDQPEVLFVIDVSGSVNQPFLGTPVGDLNNDGQENTILDAEIAAFIDLNQQLIDRGLGNTASVSILSFAGDASTEDMNLTLRGDQATARPNTDRDGNGLLDVVEVLKTFQTRFGTDFENALQEAEEYFEKLNTPAGQGNLIFLSDGGNALGGAIEDEVQRLRDRGINLTAFGVGRNASLDDLQRIDPQAQLFTSTDSLLNAFSGLGSNRSIVEPGQADVTVYLDLNNNGELDADEPRQRTASDDPDTFTWDDINGNGVWDGEVQTQETSLRVDGVDAIFLAGRDDVTIPALGEADASFPLRRQVVRDWHQPEQFPEAIPVQAGEELTISASGIVDLNSRTSNRFAPDGNGSRNIRLNSVAGISGYHGPQGALVGVFLGDENLAAADAPATLDFRDFVLGTNRSTLAPEIGQVFFVGDGLTGTGDGEQQRFIAPPGATRLFFGIADSVSTAGGPSGFYEDNDGAFDVTVQGTFVEPNYPIDETGQYAFTGLEAGMYTVRQLPLPGYEQTYPGGDGYADVVLEYFANGQSPSPLPEPYGSNGGRPRSSDATGRYGIEPVNPDVILDAPPTGSIISSNPKVDWLALPQGSYVTVGFVDEVVVDGPGEDIFIRSFDPEDSADEEADVYVSADGETFTYLGRVNEEGRQGLDLASIGFSDVVRAVRVEGVDNKGNSPGFDLISVEALPGSLSSGISTDAQVVTLGPGEIEDNINFGNRKVKPAINTPPTFTSTPPSNAISGERFRYEANATDPDGDRLFFELVDAPEGMAVDEQRGVVVWEPVDAQGGQHQVILRVRDERGGSGLQPFTLTVGVNQPPTITSTPITFAKLAETYTYQLQAIDPEGQAVAFSLVEAPEGMTLDTDTGVVAWTPTIEQAGEVNVTVSAQDPRGASTQQTYRLLAADNAPPVITSTASTELITGQTYRYDVQANDPDGSALTYAIKGPDGITIDALGRVVWETSTADAGIQPITVTVTDAEGASVTQDITLEVRLDDQAPLLDLAYSSVIEIGNTVSLGFNATDDVGLTSTSLTLDGTLLNIPLGTTRAIPMNTVGLFDLVATATDSAGNKTTETVVLRVIDPDDNEGPVIEIDESVFAQQSPQRVATPNGSVDVTETGLSLSGTLDVIQPTAESPVTFTGRAAVSTDGLGTDETGVLQAEVPASSTVERAYLHVISRTFEEPFRPEVIGFAGQAVPLLWLDNVQDSLSLPDSNPDVGTGIRNFEIARVDVTNIVAGVIGRGGSVFEFSVDETLTGDANLIEGTSLSVIYSNATLPERTILLLEGGLPTSETPQESILSFSAPVDTAQADFGAELAVGISYSGSDKQTTSIRVNGNRLTDTAGGTDDGFLSKRLNGDGATITVGGVGDTTTNPGSDGADDERYDLTPFLQDGDTELKLSFTGTDKDLLFLAALTLPASVAQTTTTISQAKISPSDSDNVINRETDVKGTVTDDDLEFYRVEYAPLSLVNTSNLAEEDTDYITIAQGSSNISDAVLAQLDPALMANDTYLLRVLARDVSGNVNSQGLIFSVNSENKLGNFRLEETDLSLSLGGLPIEVTRTYDSLLANQRGDFGYGWSLGVQDARIQESVPVTAGERAGASSIFTANRFSFGTKVYLTNPQGRRVGFTFEPKFAGRSFFGDLWKPYFRPDAGVYDTLEVPDTVLSRAPDGSFGLSFIPFAYNPSTYFLTAKDGLRYTYDQFDGLQGIADRNGNTLTFTEAGITSSTGASIDFKRDASGRIAEILTPDGTSIEYSYDAEGDLATYTDRADNTTTYQYNDGERPHFLTEIVDPLGRSGTRTEYDEDGRIRRIIDADGNALELDINVGADGSSQTIKDPLGNATTFIYDGRGNIVQEIDPEGGITKRTYDANNNLKTETDPNNHTTIYNYDARGNITSVINPLGHETKYTYNTFNQVLTTTDALGFVTTSRYDTRGNLLEEVDAEGYATTYEYDALGRLETVTDARGDVTTYRYDALGLVDEVTDAENYTTQFDYDATGNLTSLTTPLGYTTTFDYDPEGNLTELVDAEGHRTRIRYNKAGDRSAVIDALDRETTYTYNDRGLLEEVRYADGTTSQTRYDSLDRVIQEIDQNGNATTFSYDANGNLETVTDARGKVTTYGYDLAGNLTTQTDALGHTTTFRYDAANQLLSTVLPLSQEETYTYDPLGRRKTWTNFNGQTIGYDYDRNGWLRQVLLPDAVDEQYTYTSTGQVQTILDGRGLTLFEYDKLDRLTARTEPDGTKLSYEYDADGNLRALITPSGRVSYDYTPIGLLRTVTDREGGITTYDYDAVGNQTKTTVANGVVETRAYDQLNRPELIEARDASGALLSSYRYTLDNVGNRLRVEEASGRTVAYDYDVLYRVTRETITDPVNGDQVTDYAYDDVGNRLSRTSSREGTTLYTYDDNDQLLTETTAGLVTEYRYDAAGNLRTTIKEGETATQYVWNSKGELAQTVINNGSGTQTIDFAYNTDGIRVERTVDGQTTRFLIDNTQQEYAQVLEAYAPGDVAETVYTFGNDLVKQQQDGGGFFYHTDGLGSTRLVTDAAGTVANSYIYDAYGNPIVSRESAQNAFQYTGEQIDAELEQYYLRARYYDPATGRFIARDPFKGFLEIPITQHKYLYAHNDPVNLIDPSGLIAVTLYATKAIDFIASKEPKFGIKGTSNLSEISGALIGGLQGFGLTNIIFLGKIIGGATPQEAIIETQRTVDRKLIPALKRTQGAWNLTDVTDANGFAGTFVSGVRFKLDAFKKLAENAFLTSLGNSPNPSISYKYGGGAQNGASLAIDRLRSIFSLPKN